MTTHSLLKCVDFIKKSECQRQRQRQQVRQRQRQQVRQRQRQQVRQNHPVPSSVMLCFLERCLRSLGMILGVYLLSHSLVCAQSLERSLETSTAPHSSVHQEPPSVQYHIKGLTSDRVYEKRVQPLVDPSKKKRPLMSVLDQLLLTLVQDLRTQRLDQVSPLALRGVGVSEPLSPTLADWVEMRFTSALSRHSDITLRLCAKCRALRTSLNESHWIIQQGITGAQELITLGEALGVHSFIDLEISWNALSNTVLLQARLFDTQTGQVYWSEDYRSHPQTNKPERKAGKKKGKSSKYNELKTYEIKRKNHRYTVSITGGLLPYLNEERLGTFNVGFTYGETFGDDDRFQYALGLEAGGHVISVMYLGLFLSGDLRFRVSQLIPEDKKRGFWLSGGMALAFVNLRQGVGALLGAEWVTSLNIGLRADLLYTFGYGQVNGESLGGVGFKAGVGIHF